MRDLLFKNLTSPDRKRRIIASSEVAEKQGVRSIIRRHFICILKEAKDNNINKPLPYLYVRKEHNTKEQTEKFFCRMKGSMFTVLGDKIYLIIFIHSLKISLETVPAGLVKFDT